MDKTECTEGGFLPALKKSIDALPTREEMYAYIRDDKGLNEPVYRGAHDVNSTYISLDTVEESGIYYQAKKYVPAGVALIDSAYWFALKDMIFVDTIADLRALTTPLDRVWVSGYHTKGDGAFGSLFFQWDSTSTEADNGGTVIKLATQTTGRYKLRFLSSVNAKWFGAKGDGVTDDSQSVNNAMMYASTIMTNITGDFNIILGDVLIPAGRYVLLSELQIKNNITITGESKTAVELMINHTGNGIEALYDSSYYEGVKIKRLTLTTTTARAGIHAEGLIRNCRLEDVFVNGFQYGYYIEKSWTLKMDQCGAINSKYNHIYAGADVGGLHIYGGRYDIADGTGVYMENVSGELYMNDVSVQFNKKGAVKVVNGYTVILENCFLEGNCIGSTSDYYVEVRGNGNALSSVTIDNCVMNNLSDTNRDGLGICYVDGVDEFTYKERWTRNTVNQIPEVGSSVKKVNASYSTATDRSTLLTSNESNSEYSAIINQTARPHGIFGRDMSEVSFSPTTYSALNVGRDTVGVAIGTYGGTGAIQGYGSSYNMKINPHVGDTYLGQKGAVIEDGTNEFFGRYRTATQITSSNITPNDTTGYVSVNCLSGNKTVYLTNIAHSPGRSIMVGKEDGSTNNLVISAENGLINGTSSYTLSSPYKHVNVISNGTDWFVIE